MLEQAVRDAWEGMSHWVEDTFPGLVQGRALKDEHPSVGSIDVCNKYGDDGASGWHCAGPATVSH
jgi:hypothetical protein